MTRHDEGRGRGSHAPRKGGQVCPLGHAAAVDAAVVVVAAPGQAAVGGGDDRGGTEAPEAVAGVDAAVVAIVGGARAVWVAFKVAASGELGGDGPLAEEGVVAEGMLKFGNGCDGGEGV